MKITLLQSLLRSNKRTVAQVMAATGRDRSTISRWRRGVTFPERADAELLIQLYAPDLDYNGCYDATIEVAA